MTHLPYLPPPPTVALIDGRISDPEELARHGGDLLGKSRTLPQRIAQWAECLPDLEEQFRYRQRVYRITQEQIAKKKAAERVARYTRTGGLIPGLEAMVEETMAEPAHKRQRGEIAHEADRKRREALVELLTCKRMIQRAAIFAHEAGEWGRLFLDRARNKRRGKPLREVRESADDEWDA